MYCLNTISWLLIKLFIFLLQTIRVRQPQEDERYPRPSDSKIDKAELTQASLIDVMFSLHFICPFEMSNWEMDKIKRTLLVLLNRGQRSFEMELNTVLWMNQVTLNEL